MPYIDGRRVTNEEWTRVNGSLSLLHTGPNGDNPAEAPELDAEVGAPKSKSKGKAGGKRSARSEKAAKAAVADALGLAPDADALADIDVSGLDLDATPAQENE